MHIKQVIIENFKSYGERTVLQPFDQGHNVIVGPNGAGKSNLFYALQFVLSDDFTYLKAKQRRNFLHDGQELSTQSGFVEIIFDNTDKRIPVAEDEVSVRREFNETKDEYTLNKKVLPRVQVMDALQSAGLTIRNPYYIVQQGKVNQMATLHDSNRLELLKKVAGFELYQKKYTKCLNRLTIVTDKMHKIDNVLNDFQTRLAVLDQEQEDLRQYEKHDKLRRTLQLLIYEDELNKIKHKLADLEVSRNEASHQQVPLRNKVQNAQKEIKRFLRSVKETKTKAAALTEEKDSKTDDYQRWIKEKVKLNLTVKDLQAELENDAKAKAQAEEELASLTIQIQEKEAELKEVNRKFESMKGKGDQNNHEIMLKEQQRKELYGKQSRREQFKNRKQRDIWIRKELESLNIQITDKREHRDRLSEGIKEDAEKVNELIKNSEDYKKKMEQNSVCIEECKKRGRELDKNKEQHQRVRNELWRQENAEQQNLSLLNEDLAKTNQRISETSRRLMNGSESVLKVLDVFKERGGSEADIVNAYHGIVLDNFECDQKMYVAVDVIGGNRLLYHIVDSDQVATKILKEMNRLKLKGDVNFLPLNRLYDHHTTYPDDRNAIPMIEKMTYDSKFDRVFRFLFGRTLICRYYNIAIEMARSTGLECVTLEGDKASHSGVLSGGYFDTSKLRLEVHSIRKGLTEQIDEISQKLTNLKKELKKTGTKINNIESEIQINNNKIIKAQIYADELNDEIRIFKSKVAGIEQLIPSKEHSLAKSKSDLETMEATKQSLDLELQQDLLSQLSKSDQGKLNSLNDEIHNLRKKTKTYFDDIMKLGKEKDKLYNFCSNNLFKKRTHIIQFLKEVSFDKRKDHLGTLSTELEEINQKVECAAQDLISVDNRINDVAQNLIQERENVEKWTNARTEIQDQIDEHARILDMFTPKQILLDQKLAEVTVKIDELEGVPSDDMYKKYARLSHSSLLKEMSQTMKRLNKYSYVNKKAIMQADDYSTEIEYFLENKKNLDECYEKADQLLVSLDNCKSQALLDAFKHISKNFTDVFKKLVPAGKAKMVMLSSDVVEGYESLPEAVNIDNFVGVALWVSFTEAEDGMKEMMQLSGGQKSLVALGLIFAIQKFNPAPFYLFDEIDQALDKSYRNALASLIHELSDTNQFITTTFRPQLLKYADKFYGVVYGNNASHVNCITKINALNFVGEDDASP